MTNSSAIKWTICHSERYFHSAREFHPERWLPSGHIFSESAYKNDNKEASKPFILGTRACLGVTLAYMEMRIILARLVWEFDWSCEDKMVDWEVEAKFSGLSWKKPELRVRFHPASR